MKQIKKALTCLIAVALMTMVAAITARAATALTGQLVLRPLTPGDVTYYKLPSTIENSAGLNTIGVGMPAYLEAEVNLAIAPSNIVSVTWALTNIPAGSALTDPATAFASSPLGTNVPVYDPADRLVYQVAGRTLFRPDVRGQYTVVATIVTSGSGSTNVSQTITAGIYMGLNTCALCHSGGQIAPNKVTPWQTTLHAQIFTDGINGGSGTTGTSCLKCHTVGYDTNTNCSQWRV